MTAHRSQSTATPASAIGQWSGTAAEWDAECGWAHSHEKGVWGWLANRHQTIAECEKYARESVGQASRGGTAHAIYRRVEGDK